MLSVTLKISSRAAGGGSFTVGAAAGNSAGRDSMRSTERRTRPRPIKGVNAISIIPRSEATTPAKVTISACSSILPISAITIPENARITPTRGEAERPVDADVNAAPQLRQNCC